MENASYYERMNRRIRNSVTLKLLSMGILMLLLLIPASMIQSLIFEREYTRQAVISEVNDKYAILVITFTFLTFFLTDVRNREKRAHPFQ